MVHRERGGLGVRQLGILAAIVGVLLLGGAAIALRDPIAGWIAERVRSKGEDGRTAGASAPDAGGTQGTGEGKAPPAIARPRGSLFAPIEPPSFDGSGTGQIQKAQGAPEDAGAGPVLARPPAPPRIRGRLVEVVAGRLLRPDGTPVSGARVTLGSRTAIAGPDGRFVLPRSLGRLIIEHPSCFPREIDAGSLPAQVPAASRRGDDDAAAGDQGGATGGYDIEYLDLIVRQGCRVRGTVSAEGRPLGGTRIQFGDSESPPETMSREDGSYESPLLSHGLVHIFASHPRYQPAGSMVSLTEPGATVRCDLQLDRGEQLIVRTEAPDGTAVPETEVWVRLDGGASAREAVPGAPRFAPLAPGGEGVPAEGSAEPAARTEWRFLGRTGDLGILEVCRPPARSASLRLKVAGFREETRTIETKEIKVRLRPAPHITGHGVDARTGLPIRLTDVRLEVLSGTEYAAAPDRGRLFRSLAPGRFVIGLPPYPGIYRVVVSAEGDFTGRSAPLTLDGKTSPPAIVVGLEPQLDLRGFVRALSGPVPGVDVELLVGEPSERAMRKLYGVPVPAPFRVSKQMATDQQGKFAILGLKAGTYRLRVRHVGHADYLSPPFVVPWEGEYPIVLKKGQRLHGTVLGEESLPEPDVPIVLTHREETARVCWTDGEGHYEFRDLLPGEEYRLTLGDPSAAGAGTRTGAEVGRRDATEEGVPGEEAAVLAPPEGDMEARVVILDEGKDCVLDIRRKTSPFGSIQGRLATKGRPVDGATLKLRRLDPGGEGSPSTWIVSTGADGEFLQKALAPGTYRIEGITLPLQSEVLVEAGRRAEVGLDVVTFRHRVVIRDASTDDAFRDPAIVTFHPAAGDGSPGGGDSPEDAGDSGREIRTTEGVATFEGLFRGNYRLTVRTAGLRIHEETVAVEEDGETRVVVPEIREVRIQLVAPGGAPYRGAGEVTLLRDGREIYAATRTIDGGVTVPTAGPGSYELLVHCEGGMARKAFRIDAQNLVDDEPSPQND